MTVKNIFAAGAYAVTGAVIFAACNNPAPPTIDATPSPSTTPVASVMPVGVGQKYPAKIELLFLNGCTKAKAADQTCLCALSFIERNYSLAQVQTIATAKDQTQFNALLKGAVQQCLPKK